jgi:hypothetical protein
MGREMLSMSQLSTGSKLDAASLKTIDCIEFIFGDKYCKMK